MTDVSGYPTPTYRRMTIGSAGTLPVLQDGDINVVGTIYANGFPISPVPTLTRIGNWDPVANTTVLLSGSAGPSLASSGSGGAKNQYYAVSKSGTSSSIDGLTTWVAGDWIVNSGSVWQRIQISSGFGTMASRDASNVGSVAGVSSWSLVGGDTISPGSFFTAYNFAYWIVDGTGNIPWGVGWDGVCRMAGVSTPELAADTATIGSATIPALVASSVTSDTVILNATDDWFTGYLYAFVWKDSAGSISGGQRLDGSFAFASVYAQELTTLTQGVVAAGTDQSTATPVAAGIVDVTSGTGGNKLISTPGGFWLFANNTGVTINVYPDTGLSIGSLSVNAPVTVADANCVIFWQSSATRCEIFAGGGGGGGGLSSSFIATGFAEPRDIHDRFADTVNIADLVSGLDPTGVTDNSGQVKSAHDQASALGYRYLCFPPGIFSAPTAIEMGNVIFVGDNATLVGAYRKFIFPYHKGTRTLTTDVTPSQHMPHFTAAMAAAGTGSPPSPPASVCLVGDSSASVSLSLTGVGEYLPSLFQRAFAKQFGNKPCNIFEASIGGAIWGWLASSSPPAVVTSGVTVPFWYTNTSNSWMQELIAYGPYDLVILDFGGNDGGAFVMADMLSVVSQVESAFPAADILLVVPYGRSTIDPTYANETTLEGQDYVMGITRTYCVRTNRGYLDFGRQSTILRDGFDLCEGHMFVVAGVTSMTLPYTWPQQTREFALQIAWANQNSMWTNGKLQIQLSSNANNLLILEKDSGTGNLAYTVQTDTGINSITRTVSAINVAGGGAATLRLEVKSGHIYFRWGTAGVNLFVDRFGGLFNPKLSWDSGGTLSPTSATISVFVENTYMPQILDSDIYGGTPINPHPLSSGLCTIMSPVVEASRFAA